MSDYDTFALDAKEKLEISRLVEFFDESDVISTSAIWGKKEGAEMLVFRDGDIWVTVASDDDKLKQTTKVVKLLDALFKAEGLEVDAADLISSGREFSESAPSQAILFSKLKEMRPSLGDKASAVIYRLIVHKGLRNMIGERTYELLKGMGRDLGIAAFTTSEPGSAEEAKKRVREVFEEYGLGMLSFQETQSSSEALRVKMKESLTASGLPPTGEHICHLEAGVLEGFFSKFYGKETAVREVKCVSRGDPACVFTISLYA